MKTHTIVRSRSAITLGLMFAASTAYVMFADIKSFADFTPDHVTTAMILIGTIYAGHMIWPLLKSWRTWGHALGLILLFAVGTWYCVVSSAGRNAETAAAKVSVVDGANAERGRLARAMLDADEEYKKARDREASECSTGVGKKCLGAREVAGDRKKKAAEAETAFHAAPPERIANGTNKQAARVFAVFMPMSKSELEEAVGLLMPFAKAIFLEIATLILLGIGLGHRQVSTISDSLQTSFSNEDFQKAKDVLTADHPEIDPPSGGKRRKTGPSNILAFPAKHPVIATLEKVGPVASNAELALAMGCSPSEAVKRRREVAHLIEEGWQDRCRTIRLKS